ncbi:MAG TPA: SigE family RNA polymerase sigma factor [Mycobacteriales bacterium]|nr:SigE family RNA polymerase sigma factor [Mycobacteriales bacterium]
MSDEDFREFVAARSPALLRTAFLLVGDRALAEDLVQSALAKAYRHWGRVTAAGDPEAYVRRIMVNERRSWWRRNPGREVLGPVPERGGTDEFAGLDERAAIWQAVLRLPPRTRAVLVLRYWEDLSEAQIAHILDCSVGTVKSQASRGLRKLQQAIGPDHTSLTSDRTGAE